MINFIGKSYEIYDNKISCNNGIQKAISKSKDRQSEALNKNIDEGNSTTVGNNSNGKEIKEQTKERTEKRTEKNLT